MAKAKKRIRFEPIIHPTALDDPRFMMDAHCIECGNPMHSGWLCKSCFVYEPEESYVMRICRECHDNATHKRSLDIHGGLGYRQAPMHTTGIEYDVDAFLKSFDH